MASSLRKRAKRQIRFAGFEPSFEDESGSDLSAIAAERISVTPVHFDLTHRPSLDRLKDWDFAGMLSSAESRATPNDAAGEASTRR